MSWSFPNRRLVPVLATSFGYLVLCTAQRGALLSVVRHEAAATSHDALRVMVLGVQADVAAAAAMALPFTLWTLLLPERAWGSALHRRCGALLLLVATTATIALVAIESMYFLANRTRLGPGSRDRLHGMLQFLAHAHDGAPAALAAIVVVALALMTVGLVHIVSERSFAGPRVRPGARARDLALHVLVLAFFVVVVATREPEFPGRRSLQELTGNGMSSVARIAWGHVPARVRRAVGR